MHGFLVLLAANWTCPAGYSRCYGSRQCVLEYYFDDGENDCNVGTDEFAEFLVCFQTLSTKKFTVYNFVFCYHFILCASAAYLRVEINISLATK